MSEDAKPDSPALAAYLALERLESALRGLGLHDAVERVGDAQDAMYYALSEADRRWLDARHE